MITRACLALKSSIVAIAIDTAWSSTSKETHHARKYLKYVLCIMNYRLHFHVSLEHANHDQSQDQDQELVYLTSCIRRQEIAAFNSSTGCPGSHSHTDSSPDPFLTAHTQLSDRTQSAPGCFLLAPHFTPCPLMLLFFRITLNSY